MRTGFAIVLMLFAGTAIGLSIPLDGDDGAQTPDAATQTADQDVPPTATLALASKPGGAQWEQEVALLREPDGHFYADVMVDGFQTRMLVDTGASVIALTGDDATALGLFWDDDALSPVAQGAGGPVMGVNTTLPRVAVGSFEAENVSAMIVPDGLHISLLGQSFLSTIDKVEIADDRMLLGK